MACRAASKEAQCPRSRKDTHWRAVAKSTPGKLAIKTSAGAVFKFTGVASGNTVMKFLSAAKVLGLRPSQTN